MRNLVLCLLVLFFAQRVMAQPVSVSFSAEINGSHSKANKIQIVPGNKLPQVIWKKTINEREVTSPTSPSTVIVQSNSKVFFIAQLLDKAGKGINIYKQGGFSCFDSHGNKIAETKRAAILFSLKESYGKEVSCKYALDLAKL